MASKRITDFKPHKANANKGSERGEYMIEASLREVGAWRSVGADRNGTIGVGNKTTQKWQEIAAPEDVIIVPTDGTKLVIVQRTDLDFDSDDPAVVERTVKAAYYDNRAGEVSMTWDAEQVMADLAGGLDLSTMFRNDELDELLADLQPKTTGDTPAEVDRAEELRQKWGTAAGQLWALGEHRLIVGDCTDAATVARVMGGERAQAVVTDPPYGINHEGIANDNPEGLRALFDGCLAVAPVTDAVMIVFQSPRLEWVWLDAARAAGWKPERLLWLYRTGQNAYPWRGWYMRSDAVRVCSVGRPEWPNFPEASTDCYTVNINDVESVKASPVGDVSLHSTVKPVDVIANLIDHTTGIVYEPFAGSGTTCIACENLGRRARLVEIDPKYCAVILERWSVHTGKTPVLL